MNEFEGDLKVFSAILVQQYIRMQTAACCIKSGEKIVSVPFRISRENYLEMLNEPVQTMLVGLKIQYDEEKEILSASPDQEFIEEFQNNIMRDVAQQYAEKYINRYASFIVKI